MNVQDQVKNISEMFRKGLLEILGDNLVAAYIHGAAAFPDTVPTGDIDFHVILQGPLTAGERKALETLHAELGRQYPPLVAGMDGYYLLMSDARGAIPPRSQMWANAVDNSWALHRAHLLAGRCIALYGPDPVEIYTAPFWSELETALLGELDYVERHLDEYPDYCVLNLCRLVYSFQVRDVVVTKAFAAEWARKALPAWRNAVELAVATYPGQATVSERRFLCSEVRGLLAFARKHIEACR